MGLRTLVTKLVSPSPADTRSTHSTLGEHHSAQMRAVAARARAGHYPPRYLVPGWQPVGSRSRWSGWSRASRPVTPVQRRRVV